MVIIQVEFRAENLTQNHLAPFLRLVGWMPSDVRFIKKHLKPADIPIGFHPTEYLQGLSALLTNQRLVDCCDQE